MARGNRALTRNSLTSIFICLLAGCASTTTLDVTGLRQGLPPLCPPEERPLLLVLWSAQWRPDQKDVAARDDAAWQGIQRYFIHSRCKAEIRHADAMPGDASAYGRVVVLTVRELGPVLHIGSPSLLEGGTEVVVDVKAFNNVTGAQLVDLRMHWRDGGPFVIKGVGTLADDMTEALRATFE